MSKRWRIRPFGGPILGAIDGMKNQILLLTQGLLEAVARSPMVRNFPCYSKLKLMFEAVDERDT